MMQSLFLNKMEPGCNAFILFCSIFSVRLIQFFRYAPMMQSVHSVSFYFFFKTIAVFLIKPLHTHSVLFYFCFKTLVVYLIKLLGTHNAKPSFCFVLFFLQIRWHQDSTRSFFFVLTVFCKIYTVFL